MRNGFHQCVYRSYCGFEALPRAEHRLREQVRLARRRAGAVPDGGWVARSERRRPTRSRCRWKQATSVVEFGCGWAATRRGRTARARSQSSDRIVLPSRSARRLLCRSEDSLGKHAAALRAAEAKAAAGEAAVATRPGQVAPRGPPTTRAKGRAAAAPGGRARHAAPVRAFVPDSRDRADGESVSADGRPARHSGRSVRAAARDLRPPAICPAPLRAVAAARFDNDQMRAFRLRRRRRAASCASSTSNARCRRRRRNGPRARGEPVLLHLAFKWDLVERHRGHDKISLAARPLGRRDRGQAGLCLPRWAASLVRAGAGRSALTAGRRRR